MRLGEILDPMLEGGVDGVLERSRPLGDGHDFGAVKLHGEDVGLLPPHVMLSHEDRARQSELGAGRGRRQPVLPGSGLGDDAAFPHSPGQENLAEDVVDFVGSRMGQPFELEIDSGAAS